MSVYSSPKLIDNIRQRKVKIIYLSELHDSFSRTFWYLWIFCVATARWWKSFLCARRPISRLEDRGSDSGIKVVHDSYCQLIDTLKKNNFNDKLIPFQTTHFSKTQPLTPSNHTNRVVGARARARDPSRRPLLRPHVVRPRRDTGVDRVAPRGGVSVRIKGYEWGVHTIWWFMPWLCVSVCVCVSER
jgi:hypothetical protein